MNSGSNGVKKQPKKTTKPKGTGKKNTAKSSKKNEEQKPAASQAAVMMQLVSKVGVRLFRTPSNEAYAVLPVKGHNEIFKLSSQPFRQYISRLMYMETKKVPQSQAVGEVVTSLIGNALFDTEQTQEVHVRIARVDDTVYVDLANDDWQVVEIDADGWRIQNRSPVMFVRPSTMLPMAVPECGGHLDDIRDLVNCGSDEDLLLMCAWIVGSFNPKGPFPVLCIHGEQGSGKSTTCELLRSLIDPSVTPHRSLPREERDLWIAAKWSHVLSFDNISTIPDGISDSLCRISTGGAYGVRCQWALKTSHRKALQNQPL